MCGSAEEGYGVPVVCSACGEPRPGWRAWLCFVNVDVAAIEDGTFMHKEAMRRHMIALQPHDVARVLQMSKPERRAWGMAVSPKWRGEA